jgi:conjugative transfer signal peptidase TraF
MTVHHRPLVAGLAAIGLLAILRPASAPRLIWNTTASAPIGLYGLRPGARPSRGELVAALPPPRLARALAERGVLPLGVPLIKPVAAMAGQTVCRDGGLVSVDGRVLASARSHDRHGAPLPTWRGCRRLGRGEVLLLNPARDDSFDGRYFGPLPLASVWGPVRPLWLAPSRQPASATLDGQR